MIGGACSQVPPDLIMPDVVGRLRSTGKELTERGVSVPVDLTDCMCPVSSVRQMTDLEARGAHDVDMGERETGESNILPGAPTHYSTVYGTAPTGEERTDAEMRAKPLADKQAGARCSACAESFENMGGCLLRVGDTGST